MKKHGISAVLLCMLLVVLLGACTQIETPSSSPEGTQTASNTDTASSSQPSTESPANPSESSATPASADETTPTECTSGNEVWHSADGSWYVVLPDSWAGLYGVDERDGFVTFYDKANADAGYGGTLFTIGIYAEDETYDYLPDYQLLTEHDGLSFVALFPTDVECDYEDATLTNLHASMIDGLQDWVPTCIHFVN